MNGKLIIVDGISNAGKTTLCTTLSNDGVVLIDEVPKFIEVAAPVYLKTGGSVASNHNWDTTASEAIARIKQVGLVKRMIDEYLPDAIASPDKSSDLAVPE